MCVDLARDLLVIVFGENRGGCGAWSVGRRRVRMRAGERRCHERNVAVAVAVAAALLARVSGVVAAALQDGSAPGDVPAGVDPAHGVELA